MPNPDPTPIERAEAVVCEAIVERAKGEPQEHSAPDADGLKKLAEGVAAMKHGPQGGQYASKGETDYHYTQHGGEDRPRPPAGFGGGGGA